MYRFTTLMRDKFNIIANVCWDSEKWMKGGGNKINSPHHTVTGRGHFPKPSQPPQPNFYIFRLLYYPEE